MVQIFLYVLAGFCVGFIVAGLIALAIYMKLRKALKSTQGFLESEKLMKDRLQKENNHLHDIKEASGYETHLRIQELDLKNKMLDEDILLLQKSNEETEALLKAGEPVIYGLKIKLIEAQNALARYKSTVGVKV